MRWAEARAVFVTAGRPVLLRATALGTGVGVLSAIFFAPNGVRAADVARWMHASLLVRVALWAAWVALATPVVASALDAPGTRTLRTLVGRRTLVVAVAFLFAAAQLPWAILFAWGSGVAAASNALLLAVALESSVLATTRRPRHAIFAVAASALVVADLPALFTVLPAAAIAYASTAAAWQGPPIARASSLRFSRPTYPTLAIALAQLLAIARTARARLSTAVLTASIGGATLCLSWRNDLPLRPIERALVVLTLPLCIVAGVLVAPALVVEARLRPYLRATRTPARVILLGLAIALSAPTAALGATSSAVAVSLAGASAWPVAAVTSAWACVVASAIAIWARRHERTARRAPATFVIGVVVVAGALTWIASW